MSQQIEFLLLALLDANAAQAARHTAEAKRRLTESIRLHGILQPVGVVKTGERYRVIWGAGRVVCAKEAGLKEIPCVVLEQAMTEAQYLVLRGIENLARNDWKPWEVTDYLASLAATGMPQKDMASQLGMDEGTVSGYLRIASDLIEAGKEAYRAGRLEVSKAVLIARQDAQEQHSLLADALAGMKFEDLKKKTRKGNGSNEKAARIRIQLPGMVVTFAGKELTLEAAIQGAEDARKLMNDGKKEGLGATTISKASKEKAAKAAKEKAAKEEAERGKEKSGEAN